MWLLAPVKLAAESLYLVRDAPRVLQLAAETRVDGIARRCQPTRSHCRSSSSISQSNSNLVLTGSSCVSTPGGGVTAEIGESLSLYGAAEYSFGDIEGWGGTGGVKARW